MHCNLSAELTKTHSIRMFFWQFCPVGENNGKLKWVLLKFRIFTLFYANIYGFFEVKSEQNAFFNGLVSLNMATLLN